MGDRVVKFRGKRTYNGEWVHGFVGRIDCYELGEQYEQTVIIKELKYDDRDYYVQEFIYADSVDPETVGQYTGLKDKNGVEIYEGDIVQWSVDADQAGEKPLSDTHTVIYRNGGFYLENHKDVYPKDEPISEVARYYGEYQVIGSIYDNPELVEGEV